MIAHQVYQGEHGLVVSPPLPAGVELRGIVYAIAWRLRRGRLELVNIRQQGARKRRLAS